MPIHREGSGYQWGNHGKVYPTRAGAERQAAAAHANGFHEHNGGEIMMDDNKKKLHEWQMKHGLRMAEGGPVTAGDEHGKPYPVTAGDEHGKPNPVTAGYAEGGMVEHEEYEPEMEMSGDKAEIDGILGKVISMCEDPECDYEFEEKVNAYPSSVNPGEKDKSDMPPVEYSVDHDEVSTMHDKMEEEADKKMYRGFGMRRKFPQ